MNYWLFKSEPESYSIDDLANEKKQTACWDGIRNYQARNMLRDDIKVADKLFFYHSNAKPTGIVGVCKVVKNAYPDHTAFDPNSKYFDPKSSKENIRWVMVDVQLVEKFNGIISLQQLKVTIGLEDMMVCRRGARLSIQPVTAEQWKIVMNISKKL